MILVRADAAGCAAVLLPGTKGAPAAAIAARLGRVGVWRGGFRSTLAVAAPRSNGKNMRIFGGDPGKVTIFGQLAGALSVPTSCRCHCSAIWGALEWPPLSPGGYRT